MQGIISESEQSHRQDSSMKEIKAFIRPESASNVVDALGRHGIRSVTLSRGEGTGKLRRSDAFPSLEFTFTHSHVVKIEIVCRDEDAQRVIHCISEHARTSEPGDGIAYISHVESAYRIKTGERYPFV